MSSSYYEKDYRYSRKDDPSSDEEKYKSTTVRRYKVGGGGGSSASRVERVERYDEIDDDRRSRYSVRDDFRDSRSHAGRTSGDLVEVDRRTEKTYLPERPRSSFDPPVERERRVVEKRIERDDSGHRDQDRYYERETDYIREPDRRDNTTVVRESRETIERDSPRNYWDRQSRMPWDDHEDVRIEKHIERRSGDHVDDMRIEKHVEREHDHDHYSHHDHPGAVERYTKETEYYTPADPPPQPIVIRQKAPEPQQIIVQEAAAPPPVIIDNKRPEPGYIILREDNRQLARREPSEEYYYRREERDSRHREDDYAMERYDRRRRDYPSDEEEYYVKRTIIRRERSSSSDHHKKRHLAEGALAGAGLSAFLASRRDRDGDLPENRGKKVLAGAALGALGTKVLRRARSAYEERDYEDDYDDRRHRSRSKSRSRITTGLALGAAALAVAGGLKYMQSNKIEKEEATRGRARRRYSDDEYSRSSSRVSRVSRTVSRTSRSRKRSKSSAAKAAAATGAVAGLVQHYRSKSRGKSRSKSRVRTGAEIAAASLTGAAASKLWERHKDKKEARERKVDDEYYSDRDHRDRGYSSSRSRSRSQSRSRSRARSFTTQEGANRELGLVEYGNDPLSPPASGYESAGELRHRPRPRHRAESVASDPEAKRKRSKSRLREAAAGVLGASAAAIGLKKYNDVKKEKEMSRERSRERLVGRSMERERHENDDVWRETRRRDRRSRERQRQRKLHSACCLRVFELIAISGYEEESDAGGYYPHEYDPEAPPSPPTASGGYPQPYTAAPPPGPSGPPPPAGFTQHPNPSQMNVNAYPPHPVYNPADYPPPPGPPAGGSRNPYPPNAPESVSRGDNLNHSPRTAPDPGGATAQDGLKPRRRRSRRPRPLSRSSSVSSEPVPPASLPTNKSVSFIPLSPQSSQTLRKLHEAQDRRSNSDPSSDRSLTHRRGRKRDADLSSEENDVEVLPDRFDTSGRPLEPDDPRRLTTRGGSFEYRPRDREMQMQGAWGVGGTDADMVNRMAESVGSLLEGKSGFLGILGNVISHLPKSDGVRGAVEDAKDESEDGQERPRRTRRRRHRGDDQYLD
ncbi:hypothetical protein PG994_010463 [Apiospora phragmitis]|uniref:DUF3824 domain-containing protein n=1 Tax=Apiospora phragmitis TaxID=2905665 RepID=A0ABR1TQ03_9PEZI